ncbi:MAG: hypothetical protein KAJ29_02715 [Alphaproteobacteria bacterium]|nr:hypothetical protein [Alphaproteobacteria bacterium]
MRVCSLNIIFSAVVFSLVFAGSQAIFIDSGAGVVKSAYAQEEKNSAPSETESAIDEGDEKAAALAKLQLEALNGQIRNVSKALDQSEMTHFGIIYSNYTIYSMVKAVRDDVGLAVDACIKNNPDMEELLSKRWMEWTNSVDANMKESLANIKAMTMAQDYASQDNMTRIFGLVDATREANSSRFEKLPVSTPEACEFMISKMDETQDSMNMMLIATIKSYSGIMKSRQE